VAGRRGGIDKQLLDDLTESRGYWKMKRETLDRSLWTTRFRSYGPVVESRMIDDEYSKQLMRPGSQNLSMVLRQNNSFINISAGESLI
jgi:hypothetical protein